MKKNVIYVDFIFTKKRINTNRFHILSLINLKFRTFLYSLYNLNPKKDKASKLNSYKSNVYKFKKVL